MRIPNSGFVIQFGVIDHTIGMRSLTTREHNLHFAKVFDHRPTKQNLRFATVLDEPCHDMHHCKFTAVPHNDMYQCVFITILADMQ